MMYLDLTISISLGIIQHLGRKIKTKQNIQNPNKFMANKPLKNVFPTNLLSKIKQTNKIQ